MNVSAVLAPFWPSLTQIFDFLAAKLIKEPILCFFFAEKLYVIVSGKFKNVCGQDLSKTTIFEVLMPTHLFPDPSVTFVNNE